MKVKALLIDYRRAILSELMICIGASLLLALSAQICVPLSFSPIPFTLQPMALSLLAFLLGPRRACMGVLAYFAQAMAGMPVLAGGAFGILPFVGPTAGYLVGFLVLSYVVGRLFAAAPDCGRVKAFAIFSLGGAILLACGWAWLAVLIGPVDAFLLGVVPFVVNDLLKTTMLVAALPVFKRWTQ